MEYWEVLTLVLIWASAYLGKHAIIEISKKKALILEIEKERIKDEREKRRQEQEKENINELKSRYGEICQLVFEKQEELSSIKRSVDTLPKICIPVIYTILSFWHPIEFKSEFYFVDLRNDIHRYISFLYRFKENIFPVISMTS